MLDEYDLQSKKSESPVKLGRIVFCVLSALPLWLVGEMVVRGTNVDHIYAFFLFLLLFLLVNVPLVVVGFITIYRNRRDGISNRFWHFAVILALLPILWLVGRTIYDSFR